MSLMPVAEALERMLSGVIPLESKDIGLRFALGRTLAEPVTATLTHPPFDASSMDGYAVRASDVAQPPATLRVVGTATAGHPFNGVVNAGEAVRLFTGSVVPEGADAVLIQENATADGDTVTVLEAVETGANIRRKGQDFSAGDILLPRGTKLNARDILLAAAAGHPTIRAVRRPVVAILATGSELVEPGEPVGPGQIVCSNSYAIAALVEAVGGVPQMIGIVDDNLDHLVAALTRAETADIIVTSGGASVGDHDLVRPALKQWGAHLDFYKLAMRPGKPLFFGTRTSGGKTQRCLGLPGNPVSSLVTSRVFLAPLIAALLGRGVETHAFTGELSVPLAANGPRDHYMRAAVDRSTTPPRVTPQQSQDSSLVSGLQRAHCLLVIPANAPAMPAGARVDALYMDF